VNDKDRRHQTYMLSLFTNVLCLLVILTTVSAEEASSAKKARDIDIVAKSEKVSVFVDRTILEKGESLKLVVHSVHPYTLSSEPEILLSGSFSLQRKDVDSDDKKEYIYKVTKAGEYNIQVCVKYKTDASEGTIIREIKNIEVQKGNSLGFPKTLEVLIPVVVGTLLGFVVSWGTSAFNARKEERKKEEWILKTLLPQLQVVQKDIVKGQPVGYEIWMSEFYEGGYYSALQKLSGRLEGETDLCGDMVTIHSLLKCYERELGKVRIREEVLDELKQTLCRVIEALSKC